jgi:hypothetical protein
MRQMRARAERSAGWVWALRLLACLVSSVLCLASRCEAEGGGVSSAKLKGIAPKGYVVGTTAEADFDGHGRREAAVEIYDAVLRDDSRVSVACGLVRVGRRSASRCLNGAR